MALAIAAGIVLAFLIIRLIVRHSFRSVLERAALNDELRDLISRPIVPPTTITAVQSEASVEARIWELARKLGIPKEWGIRPPRSPWEIAKAHGVAEKLGLPPPLSVQVRTFFRSRTCAWMIFLGIIIGSIVAWVYRDENSSADQASNSSGHTGAVETTKSPPARGR